jgi:hypothetical protein
MTDNELRDLYSDYLISSFGQTTSTGLSTLLGGSISHDQITRSLAGQQRTSADLWRVVKPFVREIQTANGVLIVDDSIAEKPSTDENAIVCWHWDHAQERMVKGINFITALYYNRDVSLPVGVVLVAKTEYYVDKQEGKHKRRSPVSKNEHYRALLRQALDNLVPFRYVLNDVWYASAENMLFIRHDIKKHFVMPLKTNRKVALSLTDRKNGRYVRVDTLTLEPNTVRDIYLEGVDFPLRLVKQVFVNEDGSSGVLAQRLVTSDTALTYDQIVSTYRKRWPVEPYHKSLKQNASLEKSPTQTVVTQTNHFFAALSGYIKLEMLKVSTGMNHFALKFKLYTVALQAAMAALRQLQPVRLAA